MLQETNKTMRSASLLALAVLFGLVTNLAYGQATDLVCANCVNPSDIAAKAVTANKLGNSAVVTDKIAAGAVTTNKIGGGAVSRSKLRSGAVSTGKLADDAVTSSKIAPDAVGLTNIDPTQVQARITSSCAAGMAVLSVGADGSVTCGPGGPRAVARVFSGAAFDQGRTRGFTAVSSPSAGIFCLTPDPTLGLDPDVETAVVSVDWIASSGDDLFAFYSSGDFGCSAGQFAVRTYSFSGGPGVMTLESSVTFVIAVL